MLIRYVYGALVGIVIGAGLVLYFRPKPATETQVVTQYKVRTVERIVRKSDGSTQIDRVIDDNTRQTQHTTSQPIEKAWKLQIAVETLFMRLEPVYELGVERRIFGPISAGLYINTNKEAGISLGMEF